jgi:hypothetical protein
VPWPFDLIGGTVRSVLGVPEHAEAEMARATPLRETAALEAKLDEAVTAVDEAAASLERHIEVLAALSDSLPPLTESVTQLTEQLRRVMEMTAPLAAAEHEVSRLDRLLRRRGAPAAPGQESGTPGPAAPGQKSETPGPGAPGPATQVAVPEPPSS